MTLRNILNRVLRTVSEEQIDDSETELTDTYHLLVATFVNQVKEEIEDAHNWRALQTTLTVSVTAGTSGALITNANERSRLVRVQDSTLGQFVPLVFDFTDTQEPFRMHELDLSTLTWKQSENTQTVSEPGYFAIGTDDSGQPYLHIFPPPTVDRTYRLTMVVPQDELADDDLDVNIKIPSRPLIMNSVYYALAERGEELGVDNIYTEERARKALDDAISRDVEEQGGIDLVAT
jgi:hypothetical protein